MKIFLPALVLFLFSASSFAQADPAAAPAESPAPTIQTPNMDVGEPDMSVGTVSKKQAYSFWSLGYRAANYSDSLFPIEEDDTKLGIASDGDSKIFIQNTSNYKNEIDITTHLGVGDGLDMAGIKLQYTNWALSYRIENTKGLLKPETGSATLVDVPAEKEFDFEMSEFEALWGTPTNPAKIGFYYQTNSSPWAIKKKNTINDIDILFDPEFKSTELGFRFHYDAYQAEIDRVFKNPKLSYSGWGGGAHVDVAWAHFETSRSDATEDSCDALSYSLWGQLGYISAKWNNEGRLHGWNIGYYVGADMSIVDGDGASDVNDGETYLSDFPFFLTHGLNAAYTISF